MFESANLKDPSNESSWKIIFITFTPEHILWALIGIAWGDDSTGYRVPTRYMYPHV